MVVMYCRTDGCGRGVGVRGVENIAREVQAFD